MCRVTAAGECMADVGAGNGPAAHTQWQCSGNRCNGRRLARAADRCSGRRGGQFVGEGHHIRQDPCEGPRLLCCPVGGTPYRWSPPVAPPVRVRVEGPRGRWHGALTAGTPRACRACVRSRRWPEAVHVGAQSGRVEHRPVAGDDSGSAGTVIRSAKCSASMTASVRQTPAQVSWLRQVLAALGQYVAHEPELAEGLRGGQGHDLDPWAERRYARALARNSSASASADSMTASKPCSRTSDSTAPCHRRVSGRTLAPAVRQSSATRRA